MPTSRQSGSSKRNSATESDPPDTAMPNRRTPVNMAWRAMKMGNVCSIDVFGFCMAQLGDKIPGGAGVSPARNMQAERLHHMPASGPD